MEKKKILVVDDEPEIRDLIAKFFNRRGYQAVAVESALLGLHLLSVNHFDALISDINMPYMVGIDFARRVRKTHPDLVLILLTGYGALDTAQEALRIGVNEYLTKPVDSEKLLSSVEESIKSFEEKKKNIEYIIKLKNDVEENKKELEIIKEEFMELLSQELKTPITIISEGFNVFRDTLTLPDNERMDSLSEDRRVRLLKSIESGQRRTVGAIENIIYYIKLAKGGVKLNRERVDLNEFLERNLAAFGHLVFDCGAVLKKDFSVKGQEALIDKEKMLDCLSRLVHNAAIHNPKSVEITIRLLYSEGSESFTIIEVCDNGRGIDKEVLENIFSPLKGSAKMLHTKGLGLGLSICKKIVELHGGSIKIESQEGKGTCVRIEFNLQKSSPSSKIE
jgi:signal transduction histidine kinase